jgi:hypothetical protein
MTVAFMCGIFFDEHNTLAFHLLYGRKQLKELTSKLKKNRGKASLNRNKKCGMTV